MRRSRLKRRLFKALVAMALAASLFPALGLGHARFVEALPPAGAVLPIGPDRVVLSFNEPVRPVALRVLDGTGVDLADGLEPRAVDSDVVLDLPMRPGAGSYLVSYRVLSSDAHPIAASFEFRVVVSDDTVGETERPAEVHTSAPASGVDWSLAVVVARGAFIAGLLLVTGHTLFIALVPLAPEFRSALRRTVSLMAVLTLVVAIAYLQLSGAAMSGSDHVLDTAALGVAVRSSLGLSIGVSAMGLVLLLIGSRVDSNWLSLGGAGVLLVSRVLTGHPASREPGWLLVPAMVLHVGCVAYWYGSMWPLLRALGRLPKPVAAVIVYRFARVALVAVALLVLVGIVMAVIHLPTLSALVDTWYGQLLVMKTFWFGVLFAIASWHKLRLTPRLDAGDETAVRQLRASISVEAVIMTALVLISATLASTSPEDASPYRSAIAPTDQQVSIVSSTTGKSQVEVDWQELASFPRQFMLHLTGVNGEQMSPLEVSAVVAVPALGVEPFPAMVRPLGNGIYIVEPGFAVDGIWRIHIDALVTDFDKELFVVEIDLTAS